MVAAMRFSPPIAIFAVAAPLMGCATIMEGDTQEIAMHVTPEDAQCLGWRHEQMVGIYKPLFQEMTVSKSKDDLLITCKAYGYQDLRVRLTPSRSEWDVRGLNAFDYASGALSHYDGTVTIVMARTDSPPGQTRPSE
jgi:hypothetical protein